MSEPFNWRQYLRVHPVAEKLPMMNEAELEELAEDIKANGLRTGITIWGKKPDQPNQKPPILIDGRNRLDAMAQAGLLAVNNQGHLCIRTADDTGQGLRLIKYNYREGDPDKLALSLNVYRRHLKPERRRELIAALLKTDPTQSNRQIGRKVGASHNTVGRDRAVLEDVGQIDHVDTRTDSLGREQPASKLRKPRPRHPSAETDDAIVAQIRDLIPRLAWDGLVRTIKMLDEEYEAREAGER